MGVEDDGNHKSGEQDSVPPQDHLVQPSAVEPDGKQRTEGRSGAVPVTVVTQAQLAELQQQLQTAKDKAAKYDRQREQNRIRSERWRAKHPEEARQKSKESVRAHRARKRQTGS